MHLFGYGTYTSSKDAIYWLQKSAAQNNATALYNLAILWIEGHGYPRNLEKGAELLSKAAELGLSGAQFNLGLMYLYGKGVERNMGCAKELFQQASVQGHKKAKAYLSNISKDEECFKVEESDSIFDLKIIPR